MQPSSSPPSPRVSFSFTDRKLPVAARVMGATPPDEVMRVSVIVKRKQPLVRNTMAGGVSSVFALPGWQQNANVPGATNGGTRRGVPDVAGDAAPATGYSIEVEGQTEVVGGTSAVVPLWAGLIALLNHKLGKPVGFLNPQIYPLLGSPAFRDITQGTNGAYKAGVGWDACTGLGSPVGTTLATKL